MEIDDRIREIVNHYRLSVPAFAEKADISYTTLQNVIGNRKSKPSFDVLSKILTNFPDVREQWLIQGKGEMLYSEANELHPDDFIPTEEAYRLSKEYELDVRDPFEFTHLENTNANSFIKLDNSQWLMTMPLAEFNVQAGLLDHYQDMDYLQGLSQHSIIVDRPAKGRYVAFRVNGDSMDDGSRNSIVPNSIVAARELGRQHWTSKLRYNTFPYWIIYTTEARMPLLKEIVAHDVEKGTITCHSLNSDPGYNDFDLSLDNIQALFYVIDISRSVSSKDYY